MKKIFTILIFFITISNVSSQDFASIGSEWYYGENFAFSGNIDYIKFTSVKDTIISGKNCHQINKRHKLSCNDRPISEFLYTSNDTVYFFDEKFNEFQILYVLDFQVNNSWSFKVIDGLGDIDTITVIVDSIYLTVVNSISLNSMKVTYHKQAENSINNYDYQSTIIDKIGDVHYMFNWNNEKYNACDINYTDGLRCYKDSTIGIYQRSLNPCDYTYNWTGIIDKENIFNNITISPNPSNGTFYINLDKLKDVTIKIFDLSGNVVYSKFKSSSISYIDLNINQGLYILQLKSSESTFQQKILVK